MPKRMPKIFKFSHLSRVMVYFAPLHCWKTLLEQLCKTSRKLWNDNVEAFINAGVNNKSEIPLNYDDDHFNLIISNIDSIWKYVKNFNIDSECLRKVIKLTAKRVSKEKMILVFKNQELRNNRFLFRPKYKKWRTDYTYKLMIFDQDQLSSLVPASNCSDFNLNFDTSVTEILKNDMNFNSNIDFDYESMLIAIVEKEIRYEKFRNLFFYINPESFGRFIPTKCQITDWCWKPNVVLRINEFNLHAVDSAIKSSMISSGVNEFHVEKHKMISYNSYNNQINIWNGNNKTKLFFKRL